MEVMIVCLVQWLKRVVNSNLSDCIAQSKALSTVENSAFKDKQQRDGPLQSATARTMRKDELKMKGTEQRKGRRRKGAHSNQNGLLFNNCLKNRAILRAAAAAISISC